MDEQLANMPELGEGDGWENLRQARPNALREYEKVLRWYRALSEEDPDELTPEFVTAARQKVTWIASSMQNVVGLSPSQDDYARKVQEIEGALREAVSWWRVNRNALRGQVVDLANAGVSARSALAGIQKDSAEAAKLRDAMQRLVNETTSLEIAQHYADQARTHRNVSRAALAAVVVLALLLMFGGGVYVSRISVSDGSDWPIFAREVLLRAFVLGTVTYGLVFAARIYRTNSHLRAVYDQKSVALKTFVLFSQTLADQPEARTLILAELVRSVFSAAETGVLDKGGTDKTVIDSMPAVAAVLTSARSAAGRG